MKANKNSYYGYRNYKTQELKYKNKTEKLRLLMKTYQYLKWVNKVAELATIFGLEFTF